MNRVEKLAITCAYRDSRGHFSCTARATCVVFGLDLEFQETCFCEMHAWMVAQP